MKIRKAGARTGEKIQLQMTPMIDIVFQLLVFFIMTFQIVALEGDFNVKMPLGAPPNSPPHDRQLPPMVLRMTADDDGALASVRLDGQTFTGDDRFQQLRLHLMDLLGEDRGPNSIAATAEVELSCDYGLNYDYVIEAITAVTGYVDKHENIVTLVEKIKFSHPRTTPTPEPLCHRLVRANRQEQLTPGDEIACGPVAGESGLRGCRSAWS